jgi:hypothetical protein
VRRGWAVAAFVAVVLGASACGGSSKANSAIPVAPPAVPTTVAPAPAGTAGPCGALSQSDLESALGGTAGVGHADGNSCTWIMQGGNTAAIVYTREPHVTVPDPVNVSDVGDGASLSADGTTLAVVKRPDLAFTVNITPTRGTREQAANELNALANTVITNHTR